MVSTQKKFLSFVVTRTGTEVGSSKQSPQTRHDVRRDGGGDGGEGGGGWGELCWRTPPLGESVSCRWAPVEGKHNSTLRWKNVKQTVTDATENTVGTTVVKVVFNILMFPKFEVWTLGCYSAKTTTLELQLGPQSDPFYMEDRN